MPAETTVRPTQGQTLVTRLTPNVPAGIATLALQGPDALGLIASLVQLRVQHMEPNRIHYGQWTIRQPDGRTLGSEQVVVCQVADDTVEVHCHGGKAVSQAILEQLVAGGCCLIDAEEWPTCQTGLIAQAAEQDLLLATTDRVAAVLLDQWQGALERELQQVIQRLDAGDAAGAMDALKTLHAWGVLGQKLTQPWRVVLAGPPNVGKSSLVNRLVGQTRSIVHEEPGTTRDWIESPAVLAGWPFLFTDTAGLRDSLDAIETEGVRRAYEQIRLADLVVLTVDATSGMQPVHHSAIAEYGGPVVLAWNKVDLLDGSSLPDACDSGIAAERIREVVWISARQAPGIAPLAEAIVKTLIPRCPAPGQAIPFRIEQAFQIRAALAGLRAGDIAHARSRIASLIEAPEAE